MKISASCWQDQNIITINEFWKYSYGIFKSGLISYVVSIQIISENKKKKRNEPKKKIISKKIFREYENQYTFQ